MKNELKQKILNKKAVIGIIGLGYVGLPLFLRFSEKQFKVLGFDIDSEKVKSISNGVSYLNHIESSKVKKSIKNKSLATNDFKKIDLVDIIIICVPTPLGSHNEPDLSYIRSTMNNISTYLHAGQILILESTSYPCTTEEELVPLINEKGLRIGDNFFVGYSPEREDPGNVEFSTKTIPKVVSGVTKDCLELVELIYKKIVDKTVSVSSPKVAEMTKILENIHRAVNIGLVNEMKMVAEKLNIDIYEVINAAATKPFGFTPYYPGPGLGGHCIPIDPFFLSWKAKELGMNTRFIELAGEINTYMPLFVVNKSIEALNNERKSIKNSDILVLGLSYKKNVDDTRESPSLVIIKHLSDMGAKVQYSDPYLQKTPKTRKYDLQLESIDLNKKTLSSFDLVILATDHDKFDYDLIKRASNLIVDTRGHFKSGKNIIRA